MSRPPRQPANGQDDGESPIWPLVRFVLASLLFVPTWAGLNFAFGTALDGSIGALLMEAPCQGLLQRLGGEPEPLHRYDLGRTSGGRITSSMCHFASRSLRVGDGPTEGLGFTAREFAYLAIGFVGYAACFVGALVLAFVAVSTGWRFAARSRKARTPSDDEPR